MSQWTLHEDVACDQLWGIQAVEPLYVSPETLLNLLARKSLDIAAHHCEFRVPI